MRRLERRGVVGFATAMAWCACLAGQVPGASTAGAEPLAAISRLVATGHDEAALEQIKALRAAGRQETGLDRLEGDALYDMNRLPEAEAAFGRAVAGAPQDAEAAQMRGLTLFKMGRPAEAIPLLEGQHAFGVQTKADPTYVLGLCYMDTRRYDDARRAFAMQYGFAPESAAGYLVAARMLLRREYLPIAQQFAEKAVSLDAKLPLAHQLLGEIALASGHADEAIQQLEAEKAINPLAGAVYERLGDAYSRVARYPEAERVLQQAVLLEPHATGPYILLGKVLLKQNQPAGAATILERAAAMDPANYMTHNLLAQAFRAEGRTAEAGRELALTEKIQAADEPKLAVPK